MPLTNVNALWVVLPMNFGPSQYFGHAGVSALAKAESQTQPKPPLSSPSCHRDRSWGILILNTH